MSRSINIRSGYNTKKTEEANNTILKSQSYLIAPEGNITTSQLQDYSLTSISKVLPPELDIFSELPAKLYQYPDVKKFMIEIKNAILSYDPEDLNGVVLSKLRASQEIESSVVIEWIFNYFRFYFLFDKDEGDYYGMVINDTENNSFHNENKKMTSEQFHDVAEAQVQNAIMMSKGIINGR